MKAHLVRDARGTRYLMFHCPGCDTTHGPIVERGTDPCPLWTWNGSLEAPTVTPSIRVSGTRPLTDDEYRRVRAGEHVPLVDTLCHSFMTDGRIQFLDDCTHALRGQTVPLPEWE